MKNVINKVKRKLRHDKLWLNTRANISNDIWVMVEDNIQVNVEMNIEDNVLYKFYANLIMTLKYSKPTHSQLQKAYKALLSENYL